MIDGGTDGPREPWERLPDEPDRAYHAFEVYMSIPPGERTLEQAYRVHAGNPEAAGPSDSFKGWVKRFGWHERVAAWDDAQSRARCSGILEGTHEHWKTHAQAFEEGYTQLLHIRNRLYGRFVEVMTRELKEGNYNLGHAVQMAKVFLEIQKHVLGLLRVAEESRTYEDIPDEELDRAIEAALGGRPE